MNMAKKKIRLKKRTVRRIDDVALAAAQGARRPNEGTTACTIDNTAYCSIVLTRAGTNHNQRLRTSRAA
jgi:hypothetical protein